MRDLIWPFNSWKAIAIVGVTSLLGPAAYWYFAWGATIGVAIQAGFCSWIGIGLGAFLALCVAFLGGIIMVGLPPLAPGGIMNTDGTTSKGCAIVGLICAVILLVLVAGAFLGIVYDFSYVMVANDFFGAALKEWNLGCGKQ